MIIEKAIVEPLYEKEKVTKEKHFIIRMKCFFYLLETVFLVSEKMVQYPIEWNFTSNETEPAAEWRFIHMPKVRTKDLIEQFQLELISGEEGIHRPIDTSDLSRPGIEMAGFLHIIQQIVCSFLENGAYVL